MQSSHVILVWDDEPMFKPSRIHLPNDQFIDIPTCLRPQLSTRLVTYLLTHLRIQSIWQLANTWPNATEFLDWEIGLEIR